MIFLVVRRIRDVVMRSRMSSWITYTTTMLLACFIVLAIIHKLCEGSTWMVAFWMSWETMSTVGYGDESAVTTIGRIATMIGGSIGIGSMSAFIGAVVVYMEDKVYKRRHGMIRNPYLDSYVVVHYIGSGQLVEFVSEIRTEEPDRKICLVDNNLDKLPAEIENLGGIHFIKGSMLDSNTHYMARVHEANSVVIFPRDLTDQETDAMTTTLVKVILEAVDESVKVIHMISNFGNKHLFTGMRSTPILYNLGLLSVVQEMQDDKSSLIVERLLRNSEGGNPQTVSAKDFNGMTWSKIQTTFAVVAQQLDVQVNLLALMQGGRIKLCPEMDTVITNEDELSIIALSGFDWQQFREGVVAHYSKGDSL